MDKNKLFQDKLDSIHNGKIKLIGHYTRNNEKTEVQCMKCNTIWNPLPMTLTRTNNPTGCPNCNSNNVKKTDAQFKKEVFELVSDEYTVMGKYVTNKVKIDMKHNTCDRVYSVTPHDFLSGYRCPHCSHPSKKKTHKEFMKEIKELTRGEYIVKSKYNGTANYVSMQHKECGYIFSVRPRNFLSLGTRCPICSIKKSKGCKFIEDYLNDNNITFSQEITFKNLKYKRNLRFDYYLEEYDLLIEFDGRQHFKEQPKWTSEHLEAVRLRDAIKNKYVIDNKLTLLRLDDTNYKKLSKILNEIENKRSTTIEKYNIYFIKNGLVVNDNNKYM